MEGQIISLYNSLIEVSYSVFDGNKADIGGAIYQETSMTKLSQCSFFGNSESALIGNTNTEVFIENSYFKNNVGQKYSGAVSLLDNSVLNVSNTTFKNNKQMSKFDFNPTSDANATLGGGAAVLLSQSVGNIYKSGFYNNYASLAGGTICIANNSSLSVNGTIFENNVADLFGGSIYCFYSFLNAEYSNFKNNSVLKKVHGMGGGCLCLKDNCKVKISNVIFSECHASFGGAIAANFSQIVMASTSLIANTGSAIYLYEEDFVDINNCTFVNNSTPQSGGAIMCLIYCDIKTDEFEFQ